MSKAKVMRYAILGMMSLGAAVGGVVLVTLVISMHT